MVADLAVADDAVTVGVEDRAGHVDDLFVGEAALEDAEEGDVVLLGDALGVARAEPVEDGLERETHGGAFRGVTHGWVG